MCIYFPILFTSVTLTLLFLARSKTSDSFTGNNIYTNNMKCKIKHNAILPWLICTSHDHDQDFPLLYFICFSVTLLCLIYCLVYHVDNIHKCLILYHHFCIYYDNKMSVIFIVYIMKKLSISMTKKNLNIVSLIL